MKQQFKTLLIASAAFAIGLGVNNFTMANMPCNCKIAVVDVPKIVSNSSQVKSLKVEQENKMRNLISFVENARKSVAKEADATKRRNLEDKYNKELNTQKAAIDKEYETKLKAIDKNISAVIAKEAKAKNYDIVLVKGIVLYGGSDITDSIAKSVR